MKGGAQLSKQMPQGNSKDLHLDHSQSKAFDQMSESTQRPWLITGAAGFLGSHVIEELLRRNIAVIALDNLSWGSAENLRVVAGSLAPIPVIADIRDAAALARVFKEFQPNVCVHLAALHYIPAAVADPSLTVSINVHGTQSVLSAAMAAGVERYWFASTGDVYAPSEMRHREDDKLEPFNIYGLSKVLGEQLIGLAAKEHEAKHFVVGRLFNLYGPRETNPHIVPEIMMQLRARPGMPLRLGNIWPRRDLVAVAEAARAIIESVFRAPAGLTTVNMATGGAQSIEDLIARLGDLLGRKIAVETDPSKVRPIERPHLQADVTRLKGLIGWTPHVDLKKGLEELLEAEGVKR
jgi:UDP-glucose 4-epimerase